MTDNFKKYENAVIQTAEVLHEFVIGTGDHVDAKRAHELYRWLNWRLMNWDATHESASPAKVSYDESVYHMAKAACGLYRSWEAARMASRLQIE